MQSDKETTAVVIAGAHFLIDRTKRAIIKEHSGHQIPFSQFRLKNGLYQIILDEDTKTPVSPEHMPRQMDEKCRVVSVDEFLFSRYFIEDAFYTSLINALNYEEKRNMLMLDTYLKKRLDENIRPLINIAANMYEIDTENMLLRSVEENEKTIDLTRLMQIQGEKGYFFYFDHFHNSVVKLDLKMREYPEHVVRIEIPDEFNLDPVGMAKKLGRPAPTFLNAFPFLSLQKAKVVNIRETWLRGCITYNRMLAAQRPKEIVEIPQTGDAY